MLITGLLSSIVLSQVAPAASVVFNPTVAANATVYSFKNTGTLVEITPSVTLEDVFFGADITTTLPIWKRSGNNNDQSGLSDLGVRASKELWSGSAFGGKTTWSGDLGILIPLNNETFSSTSIVPVIGTNMDVSWDNALSFSQSVDWTILANGTSWNPLLNSQLADQWVSGETRLNYKVSDSFTVSVVMDEQWVTTGETSLLLGPAVTWTPTHNWKVSVGVGFVAYQDVDAYDSVNNVVRCGVDFSF